MGMGQAGGGYAAQNRPNSDVAERAMKELICPCGGCTRLNLFDCDCATAAQLRGKVLEMLAGADLSTEESKKKAYDAVLAAFVKEYGGEQVLSTPNSKLTWMLPALAAVGGLSLLIVVGKRWTKRPHAAAATTGDKPAAPVEDDAYADKLDDELSQTD
jgi:cytochrome c-type biogenesis protein CcmH/NrfF